ncbi:MAG TPA: protein O-GlcNAcase [Bacillales bacterium]|nr:protein O-GlcNAcase [Bacillales bacterium]
MLSSPFDVRGVIEGFYGVYYTPPERNDLIRFIARNGYNLYVYGPKNDRQHRARWREPYPSEIMEQFANTINLCAAEGIDFCYSLGCGVSMNYASEADLDFIKQKFAAFYQIGVKTFGLLLDDIASVFHYEEEREKFNSYAEAHVHVCNHVHEWLKSMDSENKLIMCPTDYHGTAPFGDYMKELGGGLHPDIDVFYTGPEIVSPKIDAAETSAFAEVARRKPLIWDNYPVNDLAMQPELHIGPITGRDERLSDVCKGIIVNTMMQPEASKIALLTFRDYFRNPQAYDPWESWDFALRKIGGNDSFQPLKRLAENALQSALEHENAVKLRQLTERALAALQNDEKISESQAVHDLHEYLDELDEAGYHLKNRMTNYSLRKDLIDWIIPLESWAWAGRRAIRLLGALQKGEDHKPVVQALNESMVDIRQQPKQITGNVLQPLIDYALDQAGESKGVQS